jgi:hypothetical protein
MKDVYKKIPTEGNAAMVVRIPGTGAKLTEQNAVALIYQYCTSLPSDKFCDLRPVYTFTETPAGYKCYLTLPNNAVVREVESPYSISGYNAKVIAAFRACQLLIEKGGLDDHLRPRHVKSQKVEKSQNDKEGLVRYNSIIPAIWTTDAAANSGTGK